MQRLTTTTDDPLPLFVRIGGVHIPAKRFNPGSRRQNGVNYPPHFVLTAIRAKVDWSSFILSAFHSNSFATLDSV
jgi:hypothetical protein